MRIFLFIILLIVGQARELVGQNLVSKAYRQYSLNQLDSAARSFQTIVEADSTLPDARAMLSDIYRQQKRYDEAVREATAAVRLSPKSACYWTLLGNAHWGLGLVDQAMREYLKSLDVVATTLIQPSHAISVLRATNPYKHLENDMNTLIASGKATAQHHMLLGYSLQLQSQFQESLTAYKKSLSMQPDLVEPYLFLSELHRSFKQTQGMVDAYEQAVEHDPFISSKLYKAALQDYTEALRKEAGSFAYFAIGYMHEKGLGTPVSMKDAQKWYTYAEQMHNHVAAVKLSQLYERGLIGHPSAKDEMRRIQRNRESGRRSHVVEIKLANGNYQTVTAYQETYPVDKQKLFVAENQRLSDVYNVPVELATLIPLERPIETAVAVVPEPEQKTASAHADETLTASLMASPLLSAEVSASVAQHAHATLGKPRLALAFNKKAEQFLEPFRLDSLVALMNQTLTDYLGEAAHTPIVAIQRLREDLVSNRADKGFLYYAIAFVYEQMGTSSSDWNAAEKWYGYAFQLHYTPAYQRLKRRYSQEMLSPVKLARLEKNWITGSTEIPMTLETAEGVTKTVSIYVLDNMGNSPEPIANEIARLLDLYEVEVPQQTVNRFNELYREARQNNISYQELCRQAFLSKS
jgi:tetratricopeptide (TPR) repeat protein